METKHIDLVIENKERVRVNDIVGQLGRGNKGQLSQES